MILKKRLASARTPGFSYGHLGTVLCASLFLCGCFVGAAAAGALTRDGMLEYLSGMNMTADGAVLSGAGYVSKLLSECKYHIAAVFFGFSVLGVVCVPCLAAVRGFFLCFTVSAFTRMYGAGGIPLTLAMFAACVTITLPCFFVLSVQSFSSSLALLRTVSRGNTARGQPPYGARFFRNCALCVPALAASALIDALLIPRIMLWLSQHNLV